MSEMEIEDVRGERLREGEKGIIVGESGRKKDKLKEEE